MTFNLESHQVDTTGPGRSGSFPHGYPEPGGNTYGNLSFATPGAVGIKTIR